MLRAIQFDHTCTNSILVYNNYTTCMYNTSTRSCMNIILRQTLRKTATQCSKRPDHETFSKEKAALRWNLRLIDFRFEVFCALIEHNIYCPWANQHNKRRCYIFYKGAFYACPCIYNVRHAHIDNGSCETKVIALIIRWGWYRVGILKRNKIYKVLCIISYCIYWNKSWQKCAMIAVRSCCVMWCHGNEGDGVGKW